MAEERNPRAELERLETYRYIAMGAGLAMSLLGLAFETSAFDVPRALAWGTAGVICWLQARVLKRMGESPYSAYALGVCMLLVALFPFFV